ncbi:iron-containing redox enzyme family protein [Rhodococcus rhodochrous]|uniref:iron-containing redox enzyme family protein n=1 Tax=Rhodococcus rhodochrous TaxID=1829 RepID=UPI001E5BA609|nr:iron-containing redox enzyme family protein [Rhodococcus rhodochrous]MCD2100399.1 iron-containing redox enzyme family protein [Rhodococcus rhodochrous]MCD2124723.1 iron-containing redox enzyme family protein [Rhodococcus rhodochrous]MCQ4138071.1 iron-containing redox enzyme family protein [Rhodococcus rhodochrous]MDJ0021589.1 iron-containing redox enzyme family protein [Rhodococcus rhodochrous]
METFFAELDEALDAKWAEIHAQPFWTHLRVNGLDRELYFMTMREIYHYTRHNTQNQALAAINTFSDNLKVLKFALHHAYAEAGHDQMVVADLDSAGFDGKSIEGSRPLPETLGLIGYLYRVAGTEGPVARLGYSYWAENCYKHIVELTDAMRRLGLSDEQMTFFVEHSVIDDAHFRQVCRTITDGAKTDADRAAVKVVMLESLHLTGVMLDGVYNCYVGAGIAA